MLFGYESSRLEVLNHTKKTIRSTQITEFFIYFFDVEAFRLYPNNNVSLPNSVLFSEDVSQILARPYRNCRIALWISKSPFVFSKREHFLRLTLGELAFLDILVSTRPQAFVFFMHNITSFFIPVYALVPNFFGLTHSRSPKQGRLLAVYFKYWL